MYKNDKVIRRYSESFKLKILENGKIRLHESWEWTSGNESKGKSIIEE